MVYSFISFLKENYGIILTILTVILILVFVLITIFKKAKSEEVSLSLTKEKNAPKINANTYAIYRKNIQDYIVYLFDENGKVVLKSNLQNSLLSCRNIYQKIKDNLIEENFIISKTLDGYYYAILKENNDTIARTLFYVTKNEISNRISTLVEINKTSSLDETTYKNNTITEFTSDISKKKKLNIFKTLPKNFKVVNIDDMYYSVLLANKTETIFMSEPSKDNKIAKEECLKIYDSIINKRIKIDQELNGEYCFYILDSSNNILFQSNEYKTKEETESKIQLILESI